MTLNSADRRLDPYAYHGVDALNQGLAIRSRQPPIMIGTRSGRQHHAEAPTTSPQPIETIGGGGFRRFDVSSRC